MDAVFTHLDIAVTPVDPEGTDAVVVLAPAELLPESYSHRISVDLRGELYVVLECSVKEFQHLSRLAAVHCHGGASPYQCPKWVKDVDYNVRVQSKS